MVETSRLTSLAWGAFLACSWTWCIGMFLPVILVRDYGVWGWWVFAIPNVIGAGAMGWVMARPGASERFVQRHRIAGLGFSIVTLLFHAYFLGWIVRPLIGPAGVAVAVGLGMSILGARRDLRISVAVLCLSLTAALAASIVLGGLGIAASDPPAAFSSRGVGWIGFTCALGFALCPYLDLTFHRARQANDRTGGKIAFATGFGVLFFSMILFTLAYTGPLSQWQATGGIDPLLRWIIGGHMVVQIALTMALHVRAVIENLPGRPGEARSARPGSMPGAAIGDLVTSPVSASNGLTISSDGQARALPFTPAGLAAGLILAALAAWLAGIWTPLGIERGYLLFLSAYGLVFPAYIVLFAGRAIRPWGLLISLIAFAAPMFWMGFIQRQTLWLLPGVALILAARPLVLAARLTPRPSRIK